MKKAISLLLCVIMIALAVLPVSAAEPAQSAEKLADWNGKRIGVLTGSIHDGYVKEFFPNAEILYYSTNGDMVTAMLSGAIDGFCSAMLSAYALLAENDRLAYIPEPLDSASTAYAFPKSDAGVQLRDEMNAFLQKLDKEGTLAQLQKKWLSFDSGDEAVDFGGLADGKKTLVLATSCSGKPCSYYYNGAPTGYEVELAAMFCREYGYDLDIQVTDFAGILPGLASGKYDFGADSIAVTPEREQSVNFSVPDFDSGIVMIVKKEKQETVGFWSNLAGSFERTFIKEQRWKLIAEGIKTTVLISVCSAVLGTVLGFGLCLLRRKKSRAIQAITTAYIRILQGTPILVLLMILYYIIFAGSGIDGVPVVIIAFAMNFAAYVCEMFRTGIESVDFGQTEAGLALGYTKRQTFFRIVMPQAAMRFLPVYKGEFISLVKMTSVVGYVAVQDLTKMSDIIRARTYEAFFPLIATAVIYFLLSSLLTLLLKTAEIKISPNRKNRTVKGVVIQ